MPLSSLFFRLFFFFIPNINKTNTLSHIHTRSHFESSSPNAPIKSVVWVGSGVVWAEHACKQPCMFVCCILLAGHAETAGTWNRQLKESPSYPAALKEAHWGPPNSAAQILGTILAQRLKTNTRSKNCHHNTPFDSQSKPRTHDKHILASGEHHLTKREQRQTGGETAGRTLKIQTGNPKEEGQWDKKQKRSRQRDLSHSRKSCEC